MAKKQTSILFEDKLQQVEIEKITGKILKRKENKTYLVSPKSSICVNQFKINPMNQSDGLKLNSAVIYRIEKVIKTIIQTR